MSTVAGRKRRRRAAAAAGRAGYDAFVSYSHAVDGRLAPALQGGLHRFAKPWYRLRALRVFRDESTLSATPALWGAIAEALDAARWLILLASPEAAASTWVDREVEHFRGRHGGDRILIVVTAGDLAWDAEAGDFDWRRTTALPPAMRGAASEEPRFVDLRWARDERDVSLDNARFRDAVADVAATLHGRSKDELLGEDVRQFRRTRRLARAAVTLLATLLVAAVAAAVVALDQRGQALEARDRAQAQTRQAVARQLAAEAVAAPPSRLHAALLDAAQAQALSPSADTRSALLQTLLREPRLVRVLPTPGVTAVSLATDGRTVAVGRDDGAVTAWRPDTDERRQLVEPSEDGGVTTLSFDPAGDLLAVGTTTGVVVVRNREGDTLLREELGDRISGLAFDASGARLAVATDARSGLVYDLVSGALVVAAPSSLLGAKELRVIDGALVLGDGQGRRETWSLTDPPELLDERWVGVGQPLASAWSPDMELFAGQPLAAPRPVVVGAQDNEVVVELEDAVVAGDERFDSMAVAPDGRALAAGADGRLVVWDTGDGAVLADLQGVPGRALAGVSLGPGARVAAAAGERGVAFFDLTRHPVMETLPVSGAVPYTEVPNVALGGASAAFSPDGDLLAWSMVGRPAADEVVVWDLGRGAEVRRFPSLWTVGFSPDGRLVAGRTVEERYVIVDVATGALREGAELPWPAPPVPPEAGAAGGEPWSVATEQGVGASIDLAGDLVLWDVERSRPLGSMTVPGAFDFSQLVFDASGDRLAVTTAGGAMTLVDTEPRSWSQTACEVGSSAAPDPATARVLQDLEAPPACP